MPYITMAMTPRARASFWRRLTRRSSSAPINNNIDPSAALESLDTWSLRATVIILAGIVIEGWAAVHFWSEPPTLAKLIWKILADLLVGGGLLVEVVCIPRAIVWTRREKEASDRQIAEANRQAKEAEARAAEAIAKAEEERTARLKIEERLASRWISFEQQDIIADAIGKFPATHAEVFQCGDNPEVALIAARLANVLLASGWKTQLFPPVTGLGAITGILISVRDSDSRDAANALTSTLRRIGLGAEGFEGTDWKTPWLHIAVGALKDPNFIAAPIRIMVGAKP